MDFILLPVNALMDNPVSHTSEYNTHWYNYIGKVVHITINSTLKLDLQD